MPWVDWDAELPEDRRDELVENLAQKVHKLGLDSPAILFLEMNKPLAFVASQSLLIGSGFLAPIVGAQNLQEYIKLIESRSNVERVIQRIEALNSERANNTPRPEAKAVRKVWRLPWNTPT
jgi:hypothetical protein